jgi:hypothetical protein
MKITMKMIILLMLIIAFVRNHPCEQKDLCPEGDTCCDYFFGLQLCCPFQEGVCCNDKKHCCPQGYTCQYPDGCAKIENVDFLTLTKVVEPAELSKSTAK